LEPVLKKGLIPFRIVCINILLQVLRDAWAGTGATNLNKNHDIAQGEIDSESLLRIAEL
jgi:hypothetical protein